MIALHKDGFIFGMVIGRLLGNAGTATGCDDTADVNVYGAGDAPLGSSAVNATDLVNTFVGINSEQSTPSVEITVPVNAFCSSCSLKRQIWCAGTH